MRDLRRLVLDTSAAIVATEGVAALSLREVARRSGVSHQAPYRHFPDREAILAALAAEGFGWLVPALEAALRLPPGPDRLAAGGEAYLRVALAHPGHFRVMFRPDLVTLADFPEAQSLATQSFELLRALVADVAAPGDDEVKLALVWSVVHGAAVLLLDGPLPHRGSTRDPAALGAAVARTFAGWAGAALAAR